jgi:competence protein ComEC
MFVLSKKWLVLTSFVIFLGALGLLLVFYFSPTQALKQLEITFFNVGQGDSVLIQTPYQQNIIIDGGPDNSLIQKLGRTLPFYDRTIDLIIITHPQSDHFFGFIDVLERYKVERIITADIPYETEDWKAFVLLAQQKNIPTHFVSSERSITLGEDLFLTFLWPQEQFINTQTLKDANEGSVVAELVYKDQKYLFAGEITQEIEKRLIEKNLFHDIDVLKVAHHGSKTSTSKEFIHSTTPEVAIIMAGKENRFGHPNFRTLKTLQDSNIPTFRTDIHGDITITSDGARYSTVPQFSGGL